MLRRRYETAISLMDAKVAAFWQALTASQLLDDTVIVLTSDHGEAFGEHGLYFHDASVHDVHLHVPLWIHHPELAPGVVDETVGTRDLFALLHAVLAQKPLSGTLLDPAHRAANPVALAEHFHYPYVADALPRYRRNQAAAIAGRYKFALRGEETCFYDLQTDPEERRGVPMSGADFREFLHEQRLPRSAVTVALEHVRRWSQDGGAA
jgi:arylsulfatase A-like enzyme